MILMNDIWFWIFVNKYIAQLLAEAEVRGPTMQPVYLARTASAFTKEGGTSAFLNESESTYGASGDRGETEIYHDTIWKLWYNMFVTLDILSLSSLRQARSSQDIVFFSFFLFVDLLNIHGVLFSRGRVHRRCSSDSQEKRISCKFRWYLLHTFWSLYQNYELIGTWRACTVDRW